MNRLSSSAKPQARSIQRLHGGDRIWAGAVFLVSGAAAYLGLGFVHLPMGDAAVVGLSIVSAFAAALACAYVWQFDFMGKIGAKSQVILLMLYIAVAFGSAAIGIHSGDRGVIGLLAHGRPAGARIEITLPWVWVLVAALGASYVQLWTLLRYLWFERRSVKSPRPCSTGSD